MAITKNLTVNDVGYIASAAGTSSQRPGVQLTAGAAKPLGLAVNGLQLYIPGIWANYQNLPAYLQGAMTTTSINDGNLSFTVTANGTAYLLRNNDWGAVSLTGWTNIETGKNYITGYANIYVYSQAISPGSYVWSNSSAMYLFVFPSLAGTIRYNSTVGLFEGYTGQTWTPLTTLTPNVNNASVFTTSGTYNNPATTDYVNVLVVGGGGGGGLCMGGGGGGGGVVYQSNLPVVRGASYPILVGAGGSGANSGRGVPGGIGGSSSFGNAPTGGGATNVLAYGGGGGATWDGGGNRSQATGGGSCQGNSGQGYGNNPAYIIPQGYPGGMQGGGIGSYNASGGGGGAGGRAADGSSYSGGQGGAGVIYGHIGGINASSGAGYQPGGGSYGGGGGGGTNGGLWGRGTDGGGDGTNSSGTGGGGWSNTGGGGGGGGFSPDGPGGAGGSGIVIVQPVVTNTSV